MDAWTMNMRVWDLFADFAVLSVLLLGGTLLRRYVPFFQRFLIPNSLIAGFLGLFLGSQVLDLLPFDPERMGAWVYHLLALTFISVGLYRPDSKHSFGAVNLGFMQIAVMLLQGIVGLGIALLAAVTLVPGFNPATGVLLPLGFAMGPGIAYTIGQSWSAYGFADGGSLGLTIAAAGFLVAYFFGMTLVNRTVGSSHAGKVIPAHVRTGILVPDHTAEGARLTFSGAAIEPLTVHFALVGGIYMLTWLVTQGLSQLLLLGGLEKELPVLWSFHFIVANLLAIMVRRVFLRNRRGEWIDEGMVQRMTGTLADYMIAASIMGISMVFAWRFVFPLILMGVVGAWVTYRFVWWTCEKIFDTYRFERFIGIFAEMTGTIASGLALLRVTDPEYRSPVAQELVLSSGMAIGFGFPLLIIINMPFTVFDGSIFGFGMLMIMMAVYLAVLLGAWYMYWKRNSA